MADEIVNIATFQFDTERLEKSLSDLQDRYFSLKRESQAYSTQSKESQKAIYELVAILFSGLCQF